MTILNVKIDEKEKERIRKLLETNEYKSISDFVRRTIDEKLTVLESKKHVSDVEVPDWIPDGKYYAILKNAIVAVGDSPAAISQEIIEKFPFEHVIVKRKNKEFPKLAYAYSSLAKDFQCWQYYEHEDKTYPVFPITLVKGSKREILPVIPDTAASVTLIKDEIVNKLKLKEFDIQELQTASGISKVPTYKTNFELFAQKFSVNIISAPISDIFPFKGLIGRNILDNFNLYLLGKKQIICMK